MPKHQTTSLITDHPSEKEERLAQEFSFDLDTLDVEELEQRLELQSIGVLFDRLGPGGGGNCRPDGCGWR
jgi:hypothetical protein